MTEVEVSIKLLNAEVGNWLDEHMPNLPLPDEQRWSVEQDETGRLTIQFYNEEDAILFSLVWK